MFGLDSMGILFAFLKGLDTWRQLNIHWLHSLDLKADREQWTQGLVETEMF